MNAIKNALVITLLLGVGYGVYRMVNKPVETPAGIDTEMPEMADSVSMGKASLAPTFANDPNGDNASGSISRSQAAGSQVSVPNNTPGEVALPYGSSASLHAEHGPSHRHDLGDPDSLAGHVDPPLPNTAYPETSAAPSPRAPLGRSAEIQPAVTSRRQTDAASFSKAWDSAQQLLKANDLAQAHLELSRYYGNPGLSAADDAKLTKLLGQLAGTVIYSKSDHLLLPAYVVRQGETLRQIAREHSLTPELLAKINQLSKSAAIRAGDQLKVVRGPFDAVVDLSRKEVSLMLDGRYAGRFEIVRTGIDFSYPESTTEYRVIEQKNRDGEYWIGWGGRMGIHADRPNSGTEYNSIAVRDQDAAELYDILTSGSKIEIRVPPKPSR